MISENHRLLVIPLSQNRRRDRSKERPRKDHGKVIAHRHRPDDEKVTVLEEILEWSQGRPAWQRDALRRLVLNGEFSERDIRDLSEICKSAHGLAEQQDSVPLAKDHVPEKGGDSAQVTLLSIFHHRGVNALAEDQTLKFAPNHRRLWR